MLAERTMVLTQFLMSYISSKTKRFILQDMLLCAVSYMRFFYVIYSNHAVLKVSSAK